MNSRRDFLKVTAIAGMGALIPTDKASALTWHDERPDDIEKMEALIHAPDDPLQWPAFRKRLSAWKANARKQLKYDGSAYDSPAIEWSQRNFSCYFLMVYDLDFYNPVTLSYTVDKVMKRGKEHFGGYDSVVLWQAYPRIGLDPRNQFDYFRDMPGGLKGVKKVVEEFHAQQVKVFIPYNPWDKATRREDKTDPEALAEILNAINGDGIFLDTMKAAGPAFKDQVIAFHEKGIILESELALDIEEIPQHHASWAQWFNDRFVPGVLRNKLFEPRHMQHQIARWNEDHSTELQLAWMNGSGMMVWENVFGQWMEWSTRDKQTIKKMLSIQRRYWNIFSLGEWQPLVPCKLHGVFASEWSYQGIRLWTVINRNQHDINDVLLEVDHVKGDTYYDVVDGISITSAKGDKAILRGTIGSRSIQCFVSGVKEKLGSDFMGWLTSLKASWSFMPDETNVVTTRQDIKPAKRTTSFDSKSMVEVQPATILLLVAVLSRECGTYESRLPTQVDLNKPISYERTAIVPYLAADITPVTNKQFHAFLVATAYEPKSTENFLKHWTGRNFPIGKEDHPVVWVDLTDARAYCRWAQKRLPTELEWQYLAQGYERREYPWGKEFNSVYCNGKSDDTTSVVNFPQAASPFGCLDMCGNTWELTESEYSDSHNRFCMLKGGSHFVAEGSIWYTQSGAQRSGNSVKMLLMSPGLDRSATIGFRCVRDLG